MKKKELVDALKALKVEIIEGESIDKVTKDKLVEKLESLK